MKGLFRRARMYLSVRLHVECSLMLSAHRQSQDHDTMRARSVMQKLSLEHESYDAQGIQGRSKRMLSVTNFLSGVMVALL